MGNWLYKEWTQIELVDELQNAPSKQKNKLKKRCSLTNINSNELLIDNEKCRKSLSNTDKTPLNNKVIVADFDPRSPSSGIPRTPISYINEPNDKKKLSMIDPRSPTNEYNRTPIHCQTGGKTVNENLNSSLFNDSISSNANSSFDSSLHMQQVPDGVPSYPLTNNSNINESPSKQIPTGGVKSRNNSNNPNHILQRKQVQKLNQNKMIDQDKENLLKFD